MSAALRLDGVSRFYAGPRADRPIKAVNDVSLHVEQGETVALVGESGSGKSTLGRLAVRLDRATSGSILVGGRDISALSGAALRPLRATMQMVFQDPWGTLNPRHRARFAIEEPLLLHTRLDRSARRIAAEDMAQRVRLEPALLDRFPSQLSGGQLQRVAIARALVTRPSLVVLDEPTSSLDLSVRAEIVDLLAGLRRDLNLACLFITHDLGTVRLLADRVLVLYCGRVMEEGPAADVFAAPAHPYTRALLSAELSTRPHVRRQRLALTGDLPSPLDLPPGCPFSSRCPHVIDACRVAPPALERIGRQSVACIRAGALPPVQGEYAL